jgi:hypothetical protein
VYPRLACIFLSPPPKWWDYRCQLPCPVKFSNSKNTVQVK